MTFSQLTVLIVRCEDGEAKISCGYRLPARYVISTVGPNFSYWRLCKFFQTGAGKRLSEQPEGDEGKQPEIDCFSLHIHRHLRLPSRESFLLQRKSWSYRTFRSPPVSLPCAWSDTSWSGTRILLTGFLFSIISSFDQFSGCFLPFQRRGCRPLQRQAASDVPSWSIRRHYFFKNWDKRH